MSRPLCDDCGEVCQVCVKCNTTFECNCKPCNCKMTTPKPYEKPLIIDGTSGSVYSDGYLDCEKRMLAAKEWIENRKVGGQAVAHILDKEVILFYKEDWDKAFQVEK